MKKSIDNSGNAGRIILFALLMIAIVGLFVYIHFIKGPHEHIADSDAWIVDVEATCENEGARHKVCTGCGLNFAEETLPKLKHDYAAAVKENVVNPTCTKGGSYDLVSYCKECNEKGSVTHKTTEKLEHKEAAPVKENEVAPTCTEKGSYDDVVYCSECKTELSRTPVTVDETGHNKTTVETGRTPATCTSDGSYVMKTYCTNDGCDYSVENTYPLTALGHRYTATLVFDKATSTLKVENLACTVCETDGEYTLTDDDISFSVLSAPSCTKTGRGKYVVNFVYDGCSVTANCEVVLDKTSHESITVDKDGNEYNVIDTPYDDSDPDNIIYGYKYDAMLDIYYYDVSVPGIKVPIGSVWNSNGYTEGVYYCESCNNYIVVIIYNPEYDTRLDVNP